jgi:transposase
LGLGRERLDFHLLDGEGATVAVGASPADVDGLDHLSQRRARQGASIGASIESINGARLVHERLELAGWQVEIADAQKLKGLAPLACKTDRIDAWALAELARRDLVPAIWLPDPRVRAERERARWRLRLVRHRSSLKQRLQAVLLTDGKLCPGSDLFALRGRRLLANLGLPHPWQGTIEASLRLIDELDPQIGECERELRRLGADHRHLPLLLTAPGISGLLAYTIAAEIGDISRFPTPRKPAGYSGLCPAPLPIRRPRPPPPRSQSKARALSAGHSSKPQPTPAPKRPTTTATNRPKHGSANNAAPRSPRSTPPADCPKRSGTCSAATNPSLPKPPPTPSPPDRPQRDAPPERTPIGLLLPTEETTER